MMNNLNVGADADVDIDGGSTSSIKNKEKEIIQGGKNDNDNDINDSTCRQAETENEAEAGIDNDSIDYEENGDGDDGGDDDNEKDNNISLTYIGKKPKWWKTLARRKGTKGQRNAISLMTQKGYVIPKLNKYQHMLNVQKLIEISVENNRPLTSDELLIPKGKEQEEEVDNVENVDKVVHLEIGFGQGENLLTNAMNHPDEFYIGAEIHQPGVGIALRNMNRAVEDGQYWAEQNWWSPTSTSDGDGYVDDDASGMEIVRRQNGLLASSSSSSSVAVLPYANVRIYPGDGVKILRFLPMSSIDNIYLTFPDPWPKNHQSPWRVIQEDTLGLIRDKLKPGGRFFLATDSTIFDEWTKKVFGIVNEKARESDGGREYWREMETCPSRKGWLPVLSKYESKGIDEGRYTICRCWEYLGTT